MANENENLPINRQVLPLQPVIEADPDYWTSQLNYQPHYQFVQQPSLNQLLPDSNGPEDFPDIRNFLRGPPSDPTTNFPDNSHINPANNYQNNSYNPTTNFPDYSHLHATLNPGSSVEPVLMTFQAGYHMSHDGSILPIFVSSLVFA